MDGRPWHQESSFLSSGWHRSDAYPSVLPNLRRPTSESLASGAAGIRPRSALGYREISRPAASEHYAIPVSPHGAKASFSGRGAPVDAARSSSGPTAAALGGERVRLTASELLEETRSLAGIRKFSLREEYSSGLSLATLGLRCPQLQCLDVSYSDIQDLDCVSALPELRELKAVRCLIAVTPDFVASLRVLKKLSGLDLSFCPGVTGDSLKIFAEGCRALNWLNLVSCPQLDDDGIFAIIHANPGIHHLSLASNPECISDEGTAKSVRCLQRARFLDFAGCPQLQWHVPQAIARSCEYLEQLSFASNSTFHDDDMKSIMKKCTHLRHLNLTGCRALTEEGLLESMPHAHRLRKLLLTMVPHVSDDAFDSLCELYPNCEIERHARAPHDPADLSFFVHKVEPKTKTRAKKKAKSASGSGSKSPRKSGKGSKSPKSPRSGSRKSRKSVKG